MGVADGFQLLNEPARKTFCAAGASSSNRVQRPGARVLADGAVRAVESDAGSSKPQREPGSGRISVEEPLGRGAISTILDAAMAAMWLDDVCFDFSCFGVVPGDFIISFLRNLGRRSAFVRRTARTNRRVLRTRPREPETKNGAADRISNPPRLLCVARQFGGAASMSCSSVRARASVTQCPAGSFPVGMTVRIAKRDSMTARGAGFASAGCRGSDGPGRRLCRRRRRGGRGLCNRSRRRRYGRGLRLRCGWRCGRGRIRWGWNAHICEYQLFAVLWFGCCWHSHAGALMHRQCHRFQWLCQSLFLNHLPPASVPDGILKRCCAGRFG